MNPTLELLVVTADSSWVRASHAPTGGMVNATATLQLPSGGGMTFHLCLTVPCGAVVVREAAGVGRLPAFCPNRHINQDGSFCLSFRRPPLPQTNAEAVTWWRMLAGYLTLQVEAHLLGEWDGRHEWPHGDAAYEAASVEIVERGLPANVVTAARNGEIPRGTAPCVCGSGRRFDRCHLSGMRELTVRYLRQRTLEEEFWRSCKGRSCCGSMFACPLRSNTPILFRSRGECFRVEER